MSHVNSLALSLESGIPGPGRASGDSEQNRGEALLVVPVSLFIISTAVTVHACISMSAMGGMPMPGGWTMSMAWMRMPGQTWTGAAAAFLAMWAVMMAAMMLPSLTATLRRYHQSVGGALASLAGLGYLFVWLLIGLAVFPVGVATGAIEMGQPALARAVPLLSGVVVLTAGALQVTKWKAHHLNCCRQAPGNDCALAAQAGAAWRLGLRWGFDCVLSCANLTAILLVVGVMDLRVMAAVTAAITAERLAPGGQRVARTIGLAVIGMGLWMIVRAVRLV